MIIYFILRILKMKGPLLFLLALLCTITFAENTKTICDKQYTQCINNAVSDNDKSNMKLCVELYLTCVQYSDNSS